MPVPPPPPPPPPPPGGRKPAGGAPIFSGGGGGPVGKETLWGKMPGDGAALQPHSALTDLFTGRPRPAQPRQQRTQRASQQVALEPKREQNVAITLRYLRLSPQAVRDAVVRMDEQVLAGDALEALAQVVPTDADRKVLKGVTDADMSSATPAAQLLCMAMNFSGGWQTRIDLWRSAQVFSQSATLAVERCDALLAAAEPVRSNSKFLEVMQVISGAASQLQGAAVGAVRVGELHKLEAKKARDGSSRSLLDWIAEFVADRDASLPLFVDELQPVHKAASIDVGCLKDEVATLRRDFDACRRAAEKPPAGPADAGPSYFREHTSACAGRLAEVEERLQAAVAELRSTAAYLCEAPDSDPSVWLRGLSSFLNLFWKSYTRVEDARKRQQARPAAAS
eukprot:TRINITY_DN8751_c1_g2_i1.p1 TRINITY_DN8751_c1_g2~~TRINITY_DN8751_c1_g2_i1.p1  ORF type:complete len:417 (+),score=145.75 TRINITY_DN8751_c1_g2_i1:69-1253(+)